MIAQVQAGSWWGRLRARVSPGQDRRAYHPGAAAAPARPPRLGAGDGANYRADVAAPDRTGPALAATLGLPPALVVFTGWALCLLVIGWLLTEVIRLLGRFSEVTVPLAISLLTTALAAPAVDLLQRIGARRRIAALVVVLGGLVAVALLLTLVGRQVAGQVDELRTNVAKGLRRVQDWLQTGPVGLSDDQLNDLIDRATESVQSADTEVVQQAAVVGTTVGHFVAGFFIVLFATYFFCAEGGAMWRWGVGLLPRSARPAVDSSARVAWVSLTAFVRATVLVALTDAVGIGLAAVVLGVPLALPLAVLVFLGAFVPIIGGALSGIVAVLVALVAQGPIVALLMLGAVVLVQQLEAHVLQPFLMGRFVSVHPLGIILAIAGGLVAGGIVGALIAVPLIACAHAVGKHVSEGGLTLATATGAPAPDPSAGETGTTAWPVDPDTARTEGAGAVAGEVEKGHPDPPVNPAGRRSGR